MAERQEAGKKVALSLRNPIDAKCRECGGQEGGDRRWRQHTGACPVTDCPLWSVRPLPDNSPVWLAARDPGKLPAGWRCFSLQEGLDHIRGQATAIPTSKGVISEKKVLLDPIGEVYFRNAGKGASDG